MTESSLLRVGWIRVKENAPAAMAAALMYGGICQILSVLRYPLADSIVKLINAIIRRAFRERLLLGDFGPLPWAFHAKVVAEGVMLALVGMLIGLWALARSQHRPAP